MRIYLTRWTDRKSHKRYIEALAQAKLWPYEMVIVYHGRAPLDAHAQNSGLRCIKAQSDGIQQGLVALKAHETALNEGCSSYGILDDDACFMDAEMTFEKVERFLGMDDKGGAVGPFDNYRMLSKYRDREPDKEFQDMVWSPWTTTGVQFYNPNAISTVWDNVQKILSQVRSNTDYPLWLLLQHAGYRTAEFHDTTFKHTCSNGDRGHKDEWWYKKRIVDAVYNHRIIRGVFEGLPDNELYLDRIDVILRNRIRRSIKDGQEIYRASWTVPLLRHYDELLIYVERHLKEQMDELTTAKTS